MRILLAGATGAIGRPLVRCLRAKRHQVFALTRPSASAESHGDCRRYQIRRRPMIGSRLFAIAAIAAIGVASPIAAISVASPAFAMGGNYTYDARPGWPVRNPNPWANDYRLKHHRAKHHLPSKAQ